MKRPKNYWSTVAGRAFDLIDRNPGLNGETATLLAESQIDKELSEKERQLAMITIPAAWPDCHAGR